MTQGISTIRRYTKEDYKNWGNSIYIEKKFLDKNCPIHWHDHYEIEYIVSGSGKQVLNGVEYPLTAGTIHFLSPTDFHEIIVEDKMEIIKFNFREENVDSFILSTLIGLCGNTSISYSGEEKKLIEAQIDVSLRQSNIYKDSAYLNLMIKKSLECILLDIIEHLGAGEHNGENSLYENNIQKVLLHIHKHFKEQLELSTVADVVHYSPQHLSKLFHRTMGITFKEYVTNLRMNYASQLLLNTTLEIFEVSREAGFGTRQNFTKEFKRFYLCSPSEYRIKNRNLANRTSA